MRRVYIIIIVCCILLFGCSGDEGELLLENIISDIDSEDLNIEADTLPAETADEGILTKEDEAVIFEKLHYELYPCGDGSQIIYLTVSSNYSDGVYIRYQPTSLSDGTYDFFRTFDASENVTYDEDGLIEISFCINSSNDFKFILKEDAVILLDEKDLQFHQEYSGMDYYEQIDYRLSLPLNDNLIDEEQVEFLKACAYNGNMNVLGNLYTLIPEVDEEERQLLELAAAYQSGDFYLEDNLYRPEIFYGESIEYFPSGEILNVVAKSLQTTKSLTELGCEIMETSSDDWQSIWEAFDLENHLEFNTAYSRTTGIYKLDLDSDGLMEILIFFVGGTMGDEPWSLLFLDKDGQLSHADSGFGMSRMHLYRLNQEYFFVSPIIDFNDKEFLGWEVYMLD